MAKAKEVKPIPRTKVQVGGLAGAVEVQTATAGTLVITQGEDMIAMSPNGERALLGLLLKRYGHALAAKYTPTQCKTFESAGYRSGSWPANEGDEYMVCKCGLDLGEHDRKVQEAAGVFL